ncbi:MAG: carboxypeptidase regulatory-like domain-containing protein [Chloroflexota bacterium]
MLIPILFVLLIFLAACGGSIDEAVTQVASGVSNGLATTEAVATDIADGTDGGTTNDEATPEPVEPTSEPVPAAEMDHWAGITADNGMAPLGNATISINGVEAQSDANGNFELSVPRADDGRYVINADLDGYLPISQIHIGVAMEELTLEFQPVQTEIPFDPTVGVEAIDDSGTQISIDANQLVDENGNEPAGDVTLNMYTYDLQNEEMVGDMSGVNENGEEVYMESAGAFYASFEDENGAEYNLKEGETAEISIPVAEERPDEVLTVWSYDPETGLWVEEGVARLEDGRYVADVSHFSYWNFDWEKRTPSCIKLEVEQSYLAANKPLNVRAILQTNPTRVVDLSVTEQVNVLINLPNNTDVKFYMAPDYTNAFATANSGAAWGGVGTPASPYDVCNGVVTVAPAPEPAPATLQGQVTDAVTGNPIAGAQVCINGTSLCANTDANGNYTIADAPTGDQTLTATVGGYIAVTDQAVTIAAGETTERPVALSPELPEGELRIVLEWAEAPSDLDVYLVLPSGTSINWSVKGQLTEGATLDKDDRDGFGPALQGHGRFD